MTHHQLLILVCVVVAIMLFSSKIEAGWDRYRTITCVMCGARNGEKHHQECPWRQ